MDGKKCWNLISALSAPQFYYDRELLINAIAMMAIDLRRSAKLTQTELAELAGTKQSVIARLESGADKRIPSLDLLVRIAETSNAKLNLSFSRRPTATKSHRKRVKRKNSDSKAA